MPRPRPQDAHLKYTCTRCGARPGREKLTVKRAVFTTMGNGFKTLKSRATDWLCENCRNADPDWQREWNSDAPGLAGTKKKA